MDALFAKDRPKRAPEIFDEAVGLYRLEFRRLVAAGGIFLFPAGLVLALAQIAYQVAVVGLMGAGTGGLGLALAVVTLLLAVTSLYSLVSIFARGVLISASARLHRREPVDVRGVIRETWSRAPALVLTEMLVGFGVGVASLFFIVPGVVLGTLLALSGVAVIVEGRSLFDAMGRSYELVRRHWWRVFGVLLAVGIMSLVLQSIVTTPGQLVWLIRILRADPDALMPLGDIALLAGLQNVLAAVAVAIVAPLTALLTTGLFIDLRIRREGEDLIVALKEAPGDQAE
jgi:hypothetical protein